MKNIIWQLLLSLFTGYGLCVQNRCQIQKRSTKVKNSNNSFPILSKYFFLNILLPCQIFGLIWNTFLSTTAIYYLWHREKKIFWCSTGSDRIYVFTLFPTEIVMDRSSLDKYRFLVPPGRCWLAHRNHNWAGSRGVYTNLASAITACGFLWEPSSFQLKKEVWTIFRWPWLHHILSQWSVDRLIKIPETVW